MLTLCNCALCNTVLTLCNCAAGALNSWKRGAQAPISLAPSMCPHTPHPPPDHLRPYSLHCALPALWLLPLISAAVILIWTPEDADLLFAYYLSQVKLEKELCLLLCRLPSAVPPSLPLPTCIPRTTSPFQRHAYESVKKECLSDQVWLPNLRFVW